MDLKEQLEKFVPINSQEIKDKEMFLYYLNKFEDVLTRKNEIAHFTSSAFVLNKDRDKALMIHHNIYNSWTWTGGHADGESNLLEVALREVNEETGIHSAKPITSEIFVIDTLPVLGHEKRGKYVPAHIHLSVAYLFEADEKEKLFVKEDENSDVKWISIDQIIGCSTEPYMKRVYEKIIDKIKTL